MLYKIQRIISAAHVILCVRYLITNGGKSRDRKQGRHRAPEGGGNAPDPRGKEIEEDKQSEKVFNFLIVAMRN